MLLTKRLASSRRIASADAHRAPVAICRGCSLNNLDGHIDSVTLNGTDLSDLTLPSAMIEAAGGISDTLPRGFMLICRGASLENRAELADGTLGRNLSHKLILTDVNEDRWGDVRPKPRYSIGPTQKEIPHFI